MKIKVYEVYFNGEVENIFLTKRSAKKYAKYLILYSDIKDDIRIKRGDIYV